MIYSELMPFSMCLFLVDGQTGAGQHGVATATVCALMDMDCTIYMGAADCERQALNVFRMKMLGAKVRRPAVS